MEISKMDNKEDNNIKYQNLLVGEKVEIKNNNEKQKNLNIKKLKKNLEQNEKINSEQKIALKRNYIEGDIFSKEKEKLFFKYRKEIMKKNNIFEKNKITTQIVKNRLEELNLTLNLTDKSNIIINNMTLENILNDNVTSKNLTKQLIYFLKYPYRVIKAFLITF